MNKELWTDKKFIFVLENSELSSIIDRLKDSHSKIKQIINGVPEEILDKKPEGKWSIKENVGHLIDLEELHDKRIDDFLENRHVLHAADMKNKKTDDARHNRKDINQLVSEFKKVRDEFIRRLESLDAEVLERTSLHPRLKQPMRVIDLAQFVSEHDDYHIETIREIVIDNQ